MKGLDCFGRQGYAYAVEFEQQPVLRLQRQRDISRKFQLHQWNATQMYVTYNHLTG